MRMKIRTSAKVSSQLSTYHPMTYHRIRDQDQDQDQDQDRDQGKYIIVCI